MSNAQAERTVPVSMSSLPGEQVIARWEATEVVLVSNRSTDALRELAERVARRAMLDTPFHTPAYTVADGDPEVRIFVAREGGQAIGLAVLRPRLRWGWWSWDDWDDERRPATPVAPLPSWTVEIIWTHPGCQQRGLAMRVLEVASDAVQQPISSFGWRRPFTPSGEAFVRRMCPEGFWVPE